MMKAIYAGGESSHVQPYTGATDHTTSADVVFACIPGGDYPGKLNFSVSLGLGWAFSIVSSSRCFCTLLSSFLFPFHTFLLHTCASGKCLSTVHLRSPLRPFSRRGALPNLRSQIRCLPHRVL